MRNEIWKDVSWYEWIYQVSNIWRIKSLWWRTLRFWKQIRTTKETVLRPKTKSNWYLEVNLQHKSRYVHRIVVTEFIWEIPEWYTVNHINWIKTDNREENLEITTYSENTKHSYRVLWREPTRHMWEKSHYSKLNNEKVLEIRRLFSIWIWQQNIANMFQISKSNIANICQRIIWYHI